MRTLLTFSGTFSDHWTGYQADVGRILGSTGDTWTRVYAEMMGQLGSHWRWQPAAYPASGFLTGDPNISYTESVEAGVAEGWRLLGSIPGPVDLVGYSQGAEVAVRLAEKMLTAGREPGLIVGFGSPSRRPGRTLVGNSPKGSGISRHYGTPRLHPRTWDITRDKGEMYANAPEDTLLPIFYRMLVEAELSVSFVGAIVRFLVDLLGPGPQSDLLMAAAFNTGTVVPERLPVALPPNLRPSVIVNTVIVVAEFLTTGAHSSYHLPAVEFGGRTGVQVAIDALRSKP